MTDWIGKILWRVCYARQILRSPVLKWYRWSDYMFAWETSLAGLENIRRDWRDECPINCATEEISYWED